MARPGVNRPFKFGPNDRREYVVLNGEVALRCINDSSANPIYIGRAKAGVIDANPKWQISKITYDANSGVVKQEWAQNSDLNASTDYEFIWDSADTTAITGITQANPGVVTMAANPFTDGDVVIIESVAGMTEVNFDDTTATMFIVANGDGTTFELTDLDGANVNTSGYGAYTSGGTVNASEWANYTYE